MTARRIAEPLRGTVWMVNIPGVGEKPLLIASNNRRNRALPTVLAVRITTAPKPSMTTIVTLPPGEPLKGSVLCDDILIVPKSRLKRGGGSLSAATMAKVDAGLADALALAH